MPDGGCGVPGLVAAAQSSSGSVANVRDIVSGRIKSGFVQSDVASWAYTGANAFAAEGRQTTLRAIANLYPEPSFRSPEDRPRPWPKLNPFLRRETIPANTYAGVGETRTLSVAAQWIAREDVSAATIYGILRALWRREARDLLDRGHVKGRSIRLETAIEGLGIPLHEGAARFYRDTGLIRQRDAAVGPSE